MKPLTLKILIASLSLVLVLTLTSLVSALIQIDQLEDKQVAEEVSPSQQTNERLSTGINRTKVTSFSDLSDLDLPEPSVLYDQESYSLEEMLVYAIEDEYLARQEYELILEYYGSIRIFENIMASEVKHINMLTPLFDAYGFVVATDNALNHVIIPNSLEEAYHIGVQAEVNNILMYERFLLEDLPEDIQTSFTALRDASINHLLAFYRQTQK